MSKLKDKKIGMYGGKFMPMHKGHLHCLSVASSQCDEVYAIMFINGADEVKILESKNFNPKYSVKFRWEQLCRASQMFDNVIPIIIDVSSCRTPDGKEDWDAETPLVRKYIPKMYRVYSSEPDYDGYFKKAYPEAEHIIVDTDRVDVPISSTMIRNMSYKEAKEWLV